MGAASVSLSACTGDLAPPPAPSPRAATLSEAELLALVPEDARQEDFFGASAFAKFFVLENQRMLITGDGRLFEELVAPGCAFCASSLARRDEVFEAGGSVEGGLATVEDTFAAGGERDDGTWSVAFGVTTDEATYRDADGAVTTTVPSTAGRIEVLLRYEADRWVVVEAGPEGT